MTRAALPLGLGLALAAASACGPDPDTVDGDYVWKVEPSTWLFGTVHTLPVGDVPAAALDALERSSALVVEVDPTTFDAVAFLSRAMLPADESLEALLTPEQWSLLTTFITPADYVRRYRPWYAHSLLSVQLVNPAGVDGMDVALIKHAKSKGLPIRSLETWEQQVDLIERTGTIDALRAALSDLPAFSAGLMRIQSLYRLGYVETMAKEAATGDPTGALLATRNAAWVTTLQPTLGESLFIAVGAGHLLGPKGVPSLLRAKGTKVTRVPGR